MTPKPTVVLRDNGDIKLDPNLVVKDPRAAAIERLKEMAEERKQKEEADDPKAVP